MPQHYSDERRASSPYTLPDLETFRIRATDPWEGADGERLAPGWYWWACFPGCMPDSDPHGPFDTEDAALLDARDDLGCPEDCHDFDDDGD